MTGPYPGDSGISDDATLTPERLGVVGDDGDPLPEEKRRGQLREFLETLGGFAPQKPPAELEPGEEPSPVWSRRGILIACFVLTLGVFLYTIWSRRPLAEMPSPLLGEWVTRAPSYADRGFWIGKSQVAFRVGSQPGDINIYPVTRIKTSSVRGDTTTYDIEYAVDGGTNQWTIRYSGSPQPTIVFVHQPEMTWTPTPDQNPPIR